METAPLLVSSAILAVAGAFRVASHSLPCVSPTSGSEVEMAPPDVRAANSIDAEAGTATSMLPSMSRRRMRR